MSNTSKQLALMWLTKQGFYLYIAGLPSILSLGFSTDGIRYFDVIDESKFQQQIEQFIKQNQLAALDLYIVLGPDALVEKELTTTPDVNTQEQEQRFLDVVPFENVYIKSWQTVNVRKIVAFNADIYTNIKTVIEKYSGQIKAIIPYFETGQKMISAELAAELIKKLDLFRQSNLLGSEVKTEVTDSKSEITVKPPSAKPKSTLPLLLPVFGVLLTVLVALMVMRPPANSPQAKVPIKISAIPSIRPNPPTIIPTVAPAELTATDAATLRKELTVEIQNGTDDSTTANKLKEDLQKLGYDKVTIVKTNAITAKNNTILWKQSLSETIKKEIQQTAVLSIPNTINQESSSITTDVVIIIVNIS